MFFLSYSGRALPIQRSFAGTRHCVLSANRGRSTGEQSPKCNFTSVFRSRSLTCTLTSEKGRCIWNSL